MNQRVELFPLGHLVATPGALETLHCKGIAAMSLIARHQAGDFGDVYPADVTSNQEAVEYGGRIFSSYRIDAITKVWVITEADRSVTTVLLPSEY